MERYTEKACSSIRDPKNPLYENFVWKIPHYYNMGYDMSSPPQRDSGEKQTAFIYYDEKVGKEVRITYGELWKVSSKLSGFFKEKIKEGDRVAVISKVSPEVVFLHLGVYMRGGVVMPISPLLGKDALKSRIQKGEPRIIFCDSQNIDKVLDVVRELGITGEIEVLPTEKVQEIVSYSRPYVNRDVYFDDPAILLFTSGSEGEPKGVLHSHKILIGRTEVFSYMSFPLSRGEIIWDIADWGWMAGMFYGPYPAMRMKIPFLLFRPEKFDPELVIGTIKRFGVSVVFMPPSALRMIQSAGLPSSCFSDLKLRVILSAGERVGEKTHQWAKEMLRIPITEFYSQTEAGPLLVNSPYFFKVKNGSVGKSPPGVKVSLLDDNLNESEEGEICVRYSAPLVMLGYWREGFGKKLVNGWWRTGDIAKKDEEGYFFYIGRKDFIIKTSGYRISPEEIERAIMTLPFVEVCAVLPKEDEKRGYIIKAVVKLKKTSKAELENRREKLLNEIQKRVSELVGPHVKPREIDFTDEIPLTVSGKIKRDELRKIF